VTVQLAELEHIIESLATAVDMNVNGFRYTPGAAMLVSGRVASGQRFATEIDRKRPPTTGHQRREIWHVPE